MDDRTVEMATFLLVATLALGAGEYLTRRTLDDNLALRWGLLATVWGILVAMLLFTVNGS